MSMNNTPHQDPLAAAYHATKVASKGENEAYDEAYDAARDAEAKVSKADIKK
jgi:hypothetical protein